MNRRGVIFSKIKQHTHLVKDFSLNILASIILTGVSQLALYPWLAKIYSPETYGVILTIMGIGNVLVSAIGNSINNARLLMEEKYRQSNILGDFIPIISFSSLISALLMFTYVLVATNERNTIVYILLIIYVILGNLRGYGVVTYRLRLDFKGNLICSIVIAIGQIVGLVITVVTKNSSLWPLAFVLGEAFAIPVLLSQSNILQEPFKTTFLFGKSLKSVATLCITSLMANILIYLDRIMLLPILGGDAVSAYTTASFFGKCLGILLTPMAGVLLGYYAQSGFNMTVNKFRKTNVIVFVGSIAFFLISLIISRPITGILYPTLIDSASNYLVIANLTAIIGAVGNMTQPAVLKFAPIKLQVYVQLGYCAVYLGGGYFGSQHNGLLGFSVAALFAALLRLAALYFLGERHIGENATNI